MASPQAMGDYYVGYPDPDDPSTWGTDGDGHALTFAQAQAAFEAQHGAPPTPDPVPGPPSPGAGMMAARIGDLCAHGGAIVGPGLPTVMIGGMVAVRAMPAMDQAACPMFNGVVPHATGTILMGSTTVLIGMMPAARVSDPIGPPTVCAGNQIALGCPTVMIGDQGGSGGGGGAGAPPSPPSQEEPPPEQTYADTPPADQPPGESEKQAEKGTHWIELELVDEAEQPVVGERYVVRLPNGKEVSGGLDSLGQVRIKGIKDAGACAIKFPNLDLAAWERWRPGPSQPPAASSSAASPSAGSASPTGASGGGLTPSAGHAATISPSERASTTLKEGPVPAGPASRAGTWKKVMRGECISSIAKDTGHFWSTIWDHASNAALQARRGDPNVLLPGDAVFVPDNRPKEESGNTDQRHKFRRKGEPSALVLRLLHNDEPMANMPYALTIDRQTFEGLTDAEGKLEVSIPGNARSGRLLVGAAPDQREYVISLGSVNPADTWSGAQARLNNLGYSCEQSGSADEETREALRVFQKTEGLAPSGEIDPPTSARLVERHGC